MTRAFAGKAGVVFGDVNLREDRVVAAFGTSFEPGKGGWPTHRYFNKATGLQGLPYERTTEKKICEELGDADMMRAYVEEVAGVALCDATTGAGCSEKEQSFILKMRGTGADALSSERARLKAVVDGDNAANLPDSLRHWTHQRLAIIAQLEAGGSRAAEADVAKEEL